MEKDKSIEMLENLILNIREGHIEIRDIQGDHGGSLASLTIIMSGTPKLFNTGG